MICLVEALRYRCLKYIKKDIGNFHILVGPNASGKSTLLDVISFLGDVVKNGPESAVRKRTPNYNDLFWLREGDSFELAVEMKIPDKYENEGKCRYEITIGKIEETGELGILSETLWFIPKYSECLNKNSERYDTSSIHPKQTIVNRPELSWIKMINKIKNGKDEFYPEKKVTFTVGKLFEGFISGGSATISYSFKLGPQKSALGNLPEDETKFPVAIWFKKMLMDGIQTLILNSEKMRNSSPPGMPRQFSTEGSNLPWVIERLKTEYPQRFYNWIEHVKTALPELKTVKTLIREDLQHRYLVVVYKDNLEVPSWMVSDGTLRLLALTILAYLPDIEGTLLIEEPENGIHPGAIETIFQSLSSVYNAQVLVATHSPEIVNVAGIKDILCFVKTEDGVVDIVSGKNHPNLTQWKGETPLSILFASGVLG
ncbi:MAG: ATP-binding protein [Nitrospirae bacterium YQR-1]